MNNFIDDYFDKYEKKYNEYMEASNICHILQSHNFEAVLAGGCVRDILSNKKFNDIDIATNATPSQVLEILKEFQVKLVGEAFGVVLVRASGYEYEIATFRDDIGISDGRHPQSVKFCSMEEDAKRRDFTMNAIFFDPINNKIYDFVGGLEDVKKNRVCFVGNAEERLKEDYLRALRYFRFSSMGYKTNKQERKIVDESFENVLKFVSKERIILEFRKIFKINSLDNFVNFTENFPSFFKVFFSDVELLKDVKQNPIYHPEGDAYIHTTFVLNYLNCHNTSFLCQLAGLFHDTGKAHCTTQKNGRIISYGHEKTSTEIAERWMKKYKFSNDDIQYVLGIVSNHMKFHQKGMSNATLRKLMVQPFFNELIVHVEADVDSSSQDWSIINEYKERIENLRENQLPERVFTGEDLIQLGLKPSEEFGEILRDMYDAQLNGKFNNNAEAWKYLIDNFSKRLRINGYIIRESRGENK